MSKKITGFEFNLGDEAKDLVSGYQGIIDCRSEWLNGCHRYSLQAPMKKGAEKMPQSYWFDSQQIKLVKSKKKSVKKTGTGGPTTRSPRM